MATVVPAADPGPCPFCQPDLGRLVFETPLVRAVWDKYPAVPGHLLLVPRRHVAMWSDLTAAERHALADAIADAQELLEARDSPDGFTIGINHGVAAGQTVPHLHIHVIPRHSGDVPDPTGGVRHVIPARGNYRALAATDPTGDGDG